MWSGLQPCDEGFVVFDIAFSCLLSLFVKCALQLPFRLVPLAHKISRQPSTLVFARHVCLALIA
jgi:hypothetical protein